MTRELSMQRSPAAIKGSEKMRGESRLVIYVESSEDVIIYKRFINFEHIEFTPASGWENVKKLVDDAEDKDKRIGIIDADFTHITHKYRTDSERIFLTDTHDLETLVISLVEEKLISYRLISEDIIEAAKNIAKQIGILRFINNETGSDRFGLRFRDGDKKLPYYEASNLYQNQVFKSVIDFNLSIVDFMTKGYSKQKEIQLEFTEKLEEKLDDFQIINGHDLLPILNKLVSQKIKYYKFDRETEKVFLLDLVSKIDKEDFQHTKLYQEVSAYCLTVLS